MNASHISAIPSDEQEKFHNHLHTFPMNAIIIQEGQDDNALYLLREGKVAVERGRVTQIATIDAVNFFGEMAMIIKAPRSATIRVISTKAIVYKFQSFDLHAIYNNPAWSELLITRLCNNLAEIDKRVEMATKDRHRFSEKMKSLAEQSNEMYSALLSMQTELSDNHSDIVKEQKLVHHLQVNKHFPRTR